MSNRACMVASDEEDEDGNLSEIQPRATKSTREILPVGEVVYLPNDTTSFKAEEEETTKKPIPVVYINTNSDNEDDIDLKTLSGKRVVEASSESENKRGRFSEEATHSVNVSKNTVVETKPSENEKTPTLNSDKKDSDKTENKSKNAIPFSSSKAADLMPPAARRCNTVENSCNRKAKYARQATPICDAIMKEYSKRQKLMKMQGNKGIPDLSDMPIQELLKKAKEGKLGDSKSQLNKSPAKTSNINTVPVGESSTTLKNKDTSKEPSAEKQKDPLRVVVKEEVDVKPAFVSCETISDTKPNVSEKPVKYDKEISSALKTRPRRGVRGRRSSDDDPDFVLPSHKTTSAKQKPSIISKDSSEKLSKQQTQKDKLPVVVKQEIDTISEDDTVFVLPQKDTNFVKQNSVQSKDSHELFAQKQSDQLVIKEEVVDIKPSFETYETYGAKMNPTVSLIDVAPRISIEENRRRPGRPRKVKESDSPVVLPKKTARAASSLNSSVSAELPKTPQENNYSLRTRQRSATKKEKILEVGKNNNQESLESSASDSTSHIDQVRENRSNTPKPEEVLSVAKQLTLIAEKIANVLSKESTPNINSEAKKLLETTQKLLKIQREALQKSSESACLSPSLESQQPVKIKQEVLDESVDTSVAVPSPSIDTTITFGEMLKSSNFPESQSQTSIQVPDSFFVHGNNKHGQISNVQSKETKEVNSSDTNIYNQLNTYKKALQEKLGITQTHVEGNISPDLSVKNTAQDSTQRIKKQFVCAPETSLSAKEKCVFVMDYFLSYQEIFDKEVFEKILPFLAEIVLFCMNDITDCWEKNKNMKNLKAEELRQQQMTIAQQSCVKMTKTYGKKFLTTFTLMINKITKTKAKKAILVTLVYYLTGSLFSKAPKYRKQLHGVRKILSVILKMYKYDDPLVWMVLQAPNTTFENELKLVKQILKYFKAQNYVLLPNDSILNFYETDDVQEQLHSLEVSQFIGPKTSSVQSHGINRENPKRSDIAVKFFESLQTESHYDVKRIEQKLDHILSVLSGNSEIEHDTYPFLSGKTVKTSKVEHSRVGSLGGTYLNNPSAKPHTSQAANAENASSQSAISSSIDKGNMLAHLVESDHIGLDSLFQSYIKSTTEQRVKIKSEPVDFPAETYTEGIDLGSSAASLNINNGADEMFGFVKVKQEREETKADTVSRHVVSEELSSVSHLYSNQDEPLPFASVSVWGQPSISNENSQSDDSIVFTTPLEECILDEFTEEPVVYPKFEKHELDYDPLLE